MSGVNFNSTTTKPQTAARAITTKTTTYAALSTDDTILCDTSGGAWTLSLPAAGDNTGKEFTIKKTTNDTNALTIDTNASEKIDGNDTHELRAQYEFIVVTSNGSHWFIITSYYNEIKTAEDSSSAAWAITAGQWGDIDSLSLTPGKWELSGRISTFNNGAITTVYIQVGYGTTSGNNAPTVGFPMYHSPSLTSNHRALIAPQTWTVTVASTTTYYLKGFGQTSVANLEEVHSFIAKRVG